MCGSAALKTSVCSPVISSFPGALATEIIVEISFPTSKLAPIDAIPNSAGRIHSLKNGVAPPNVYELEPREQLFHGVQALRLKPVGGGDIYGRTGLLAHTYMLGPNGDSNGCVSFKNYNSFLQAFQNGEVKRLVVVARLN
jgi:hypothetical protein